MPGVDSDNDLPQLLNSAEKQLKWAKQLVSKYMGCATEDTTERPDIQGMFSRTWFLKLTDGREVVVQFRNEPLDVEPFVTAKRVLGPSYVPDIQALPSDELESAGAWAYCMSRMPGRTWLKGVAGHGAEGRITINKTLGRVFSRGFVSDNMNEIHQVIETKIRPHITAILESTSESIMPYKEIVERYSKRLDDFAKLPLWIAHYDLNEVNILIDEKCEVTALIDWELSTPLPFGVGLGRIHTIAGEYYKGEFEIPEEYEACERGFWTELFEGMPEHIRNGLCGNIELVQDAVILGTLLSCFNFEAGELGYGKVSIKALPKFLTYRLPFIRGDEKAYRD